MLQDAIDPAALKRVLVIKLRHHGDVLLTSPVFTTLKRCAPQAELDALVYADTAPMLRGHPALSQLFTIDRHWKRAGRWAQLRHEWALFQALRARRYDLIVHLTDHNRGATLARLLKPRWAVAPAGKTSRRFAKAFTHRYPVVGGNRRHTVELHLTPCAAWACTPARQSAGWCCAHRLRRASGWTPNWRRWACRPGSSSIFTPPRAGCSKPGPPRTWRR